MWPWLCRIIALMSWAVIFEMVAGGVGYNGRIEMWNGMGWVCRRAGMEDDLFSFRCEDDLRWTRYTCNILPIV